MQPKYGKKSKLCYMDTDDICKDIAEDVETKFDTSSYELARPLPKGKNKKVTRSMKGELVGSIITKIC